MITSLLDPTPDDRVDGVTWRPQSPRTGRELVADNLRRRWEAVRRFRPSRLLRSARTLRALSHASGGSAPSTSLTGPIGRHRQLTVLRFPIVELRAAAHAHGCTINDLLIAAVTAGLRDLLSGRGECRDGLELRASVPVGARGGGSEGGMFLAPLPVGVSDDAERLRIIKQATVKGKGRPDQGVAGIVALPASLAWLGVAWAKRAAASHINLYVTNVPGPASALYFAGARLLRAVPLAPLVAGVRLSVAALSYDGQFAISLLADNSMPDLPVLAAGVRAAFEGLRQHRIGAVTTCTGPPGSSSWAMARRWNGMPNSAMLFNRFRCWRGIMMRWRAALDGSDRLVQSQGNGCATDATDCRSTPGHAATSAIAPTK
jgi:diacylglycerol O-acyltransferase / wax synthase